MARSEAGDAPVDADRGVEQLYAAQWVPMVRLAYLLLRDQGRAEDVVADALVAIHRRWAHLEEPANAVAYLRRSVVNGCRSVQRHSQVEHAKLQITHAREAHERVAGSAEEAALSALGNAAMLDAIDALPRRQREVLLLRYFLDLSEAQIAQTLEISAGSVKAHASRALAALRRDLAADPPATPREHT